MSLTVSDRFGGESTTASQGRRPLVVAASLSLHGLALLALLALSHRVALHEPPPVEIEMRFEAPATPLEAALVPDTAPPTPAAPGPDAPADVTPDLAEASPPLPAAIANPPLPAALTNPPLPAAIANPPLPAAIANPPPPATIANLAPPVPTPAPEPAPSPVVENAPNPAIDNPPTPATPQIATAAAEPPAELAEIPKPEIAPPPEPHTPPVHRPAPTRVVARVTIPERRAARPEAPSAPSPPVAMAAPQAPSAPIPQPHPQPPPPVRTAAISARWQGELAGWIRSRTRYPDAARQRGEQGAVVISFTVGRDGQVTDALLRQRSGSDTLDQAALAMFRAARVPAFTPDMEAAQVTISVPVRYRLEE